MMTMKGEFAKRVDCGEAVSEGEGAVMLFTYQA